MTTGSLIKNARKKAGMTQKELGDKLGLSFQAIAQWENNLRNPKQETIQRIADALNIEWYELLPEKQQGDAIVKDVIKRLGENKFTWRKMSDGEKEKAGFTPFNSEEDRIAHFYGLLNIYGKLDASRCFYKHLNVDALKEVADYVESLSEVPQYQQPAEPQDEQPDMDE